MNRERARCNPPSPPSRPPSSGCANIVPRPGQDVSSHSRCGEYHRHTELSWDGSPDGSLEDMFRYAIDAAQMDWIGNGDHDNGAGREYPWWLTQKFTDAYHNAKSFTTMFTYERSVAYPHGHRNVMFACAAASSRCRVSPRPKARRPSKKARRRAAGPAASIPTTPRCSTATSTNSTASAPAQLPRGTGMGTGIKATYDLGRGADRRNLSRRPHVVRDGRRPARRL